MATKATLKLKGVKKADPGQLPPPPEAIATDITTVVTQMFSGKKKPQPPAPTLEQPVKIKAKPATFFKADAKAPAVAKAPLGAEAPLQVAEAVAPAEAPLQVADAEPPAEAPAQVAEDVAPADAPQEAPAPAKKVRKIKKDLNPELTALQASVRAEESKSPYSTTIGPDYVPPNSKAFSRYIESAFAEFTLPPTFAVKNFDACSSMTLQTYKYQEFIREYMRSASPYRGVLVYHGLGSGKTCTSIAAAEALYGTSNKKIIVMTPISLQENFINEVSFCGFRHFRLKNFWVPFSLANPLQRNFATEIVGIPEKHIELVLKSADPAKQVFWLPDFSKSEEQSNFDTLSDENKDAIRKQIRAILTSRITFIGYTGISQDALKQIAVDRKDFFDNAVIIIDEVHNITRLMRGKLDKYLRNVVEEQQRKAPGQQMPKKAKLPASYEPVTVTPWEPKLAGSSQKYERAFLFYRLLVQAKNSKIIALSGTPIVNFPEEIGILANILHGYFHAVQVRLPTTSDADLKTVHGILKLHPRIGFYSLEKSSTDTGVFFTALQPGYIKHIEDNVFKGVVQVADASPESITDIFAEVSRELASANPKLRFSEPKYEAIPLFPPTVDEFRHYFVNTDTFKIKNPTLFMNRISGLVSYYKGAKEELMPQVTKDEIIKVPLSAYALGPYAEARAKERKEEERLGKASTSAQELDGLAGSEKESASYRFRSRASCNFVFPEDIPRPFPTNLKELKKAAKVEENVLGDNDADVVEDDEASVAIQEDEEEDEEESVLEEEGAEGVVAKPVATKPLPKEVYALADKAGDVSIDYDTRVKYALQALRMAAPILFKKGEETASESLAKYSPKFSIIIDKILESKGSSLVYSQFKTLEGIGILGVCLEANGFAPIKLTGPDTDLAFSPDTQKSFLENPTQPRFIVYSGEETRVMRQTLINIFNMRMDKLPAKITSVLERSGVIPTGNLKGEVARVFMITGAGAEGLSLKCVRTVHILEPYWNKVRTDQVKGRAVRICSHKDLPYDPDPTKNQRTVEIFTYISTFSAQMIKDREIDATLLTKDDGETTDEHILKISDLKDQIGTDFINAMKASAIDCVLNLAENEKIQCFVQDGPIDDFVYDPRIKVDEKLTEIQVKLKEKKPLVALPAIAEAKEGEAIAQAQAEPPPLKYPVVKAKGIEYMRVPRKDAEGKPYDGLFALVDRRLTKELGKIVVGADGKPKMTLYKV